MKNWSHQATWKAAWVTALLPLAINGYAAPGQCHGKTAGYNGYRVTAVEVKNPVGFIAPGSSERLKKNLRIKPGAAFSQDDLEQDSAYLNQALSGDFDLSTQKVKLSFVTEEILDCDDVAHSLRVVYPIFTNVVSSLIAPSIEEESSESHRPATTAALRSSAATLQVTPTAGYNRTLGTWGGVTFSETLGKLHLKGETEDSGKSRTGYLDLGLTAGPVKKLWNAADLQATFDYEDTPAGTARYQEGKLTSRFSASTMETARTHMIFRYGASLEGGHQQSSAPADLPNSSYGSLKMYAGLTGRPGHDAFTASYGLQLGNTFLHDVPVFKKHLLDLGYNANVPVPHHKPLGDSEGFKSPLSAAVHRSLSLDTRATAGLIEDVRAAPLAERFLGGNQIRPLVKDDAWVIPADAYIRSIAENELGAQKGREPGGSRFYSANLTVGFTVWGRSILPQDLASAKGFPEVLNAPFDTAARTLANENKKKDPTYIEATKEVTANAAELAKALKALADTVAEIPADVTAKPPLTATVKALHSNLLSAKGAATLLTSQPDPQTLERLVKQLLPALHSVAGKLTGALRAQSRPDLAELANQIDRLMPAIDTPAQKLRAADADPPERYVEQAWRTLAPAHRALDVFLHDMNIYSVAPVAIVDAARVWPVNQGVRYGLGGGLRLSLVNANFTMGYAANPDRSPGERAGALFIHLDVTSLF